MALTAKQKLFVQEYLKDLNATQAAIRAGYSERTANEQGSRLLTKVSVQEAIQEAMDERSARTKITSDMVLERWWDIATADPNELIHMRRLNCRYCHGINHEYQWVDENEFRMALRAAESEGQNEDGEEAEIILPSDEGGYGFNKLADPSPECPRCLGEGILDLHIEDTRKLKGKAKLLYAGVKQTQAGIEIKMHDQDKALENVARHLGMFKDKLELSGSVGIEKLLEDL